MPQRRLFEGWDGRWVAVAIVFAFLEGLKIIALILGVPMFELPPFSWFGPMAPYFADLYVPIAGAERLHAGISPFVADLHDPWNRPFNYPKIWLYMDYIGLNAHTAMAFGYGLCVLFFVSAYCALGRLTALGGAVAGLFLISYAVMFGLERANADVLVFALMALVLGLRRFPELAALVIAFAAILKLYPIFALFAFVSLPWKKAGSSIALGLVVFLAVELTDIQAVFKAMTYAPNMRTGTLSFGTTSWGLDIMDRFNRPDLYADVVAIGSGLFILIIGVAAWVRPPLKVDALDERELFAFRLGASLYLGSFALGTNHDYRAIFLLLCLPLLLKLLRTEIIVRRWAVTTLALIMVYAHWKLFSGEAQWHHFLLKQATAWGIAFGLAGFCVATLPRALQWPRRIP